MPNRIRKDTEERDCTAQRNALIEALKPIPEEAWLRVIKLEPEWPAIDLLLKKADFGKTAVFLIMMGLNAFQLKGKAEENYWRDVEGIFDGCETPASPKELLPKLEPFYKTERIPTAKIKRLHRFLESPLADLLWRLSPQECAFRFLSIWENLAETMKQNRRAKTICFAMKCLGLTLLAYEEFGFDFSGIPIPVDSRVTRFTCALGMHESEDESHIRDIWDQVLGSLQAFNPRVDMIMLDSLVWQITGMDQEEMHRYFENLGIAHVGADLVCLLEEKST